MPVKKEGFWTVVMQKRAGGRLQERHVSSLAAVWKVKKVSGSGWLIKVVRVECMYSSNPPAIIWFAVFMHLDSTKCKDLKKKSVESPSCQTHKLSLMVFKYLRSVTAVISTSERGHSFLWCHVWDLPETETVKHSQEEQNKGRRGLDREHRSRGGVTLWSQSASGKWMKIMIPQLLGLALCLNANYNLHPLVFKRILYAYLHYQSRNARGKLGKSRHNRSSLHFFFPIASSQWLPWRPQIHKDLVNHSASNVIQPTLVPQFPCQKKGNLLLLVFSSGEINNKKRLKVAYWGAKICLNSYRDCRSGAPFYSCDLSLYMLNLQRNAVSMPSSHHSRMAASSPCAFSFLYGKSGKSFSLHFNNT